MTGYIYLFFVLFGCSCFFSILRGSKNNYDLPVSFCLITIILYSFSLFHLLIFSTQLIQYIGILGFVIFVLSYYKKPQKYNFLVGRFYLFLGIFLLSYIASWGSDYCAWDEYSHWGAQIEFLKVNRELHTDANLLLFPDYVPGLSLWRHLAVQFNLEDSSSGPYFLNWILVFSIFGGLSNEWANRKNWIKVLACFFAYVFFFQSLVLTLYVDTIQSLLILLTLSILLEKITPTHNDIFSICILVTTIVITKHVGLIFSAFIIVLYLYKLKTSQSCNLGKLFKHGLILMLVVGVSFLSWSIYVNYYGLAIKVIDFNELFNGQYSVFSKVIENVIGVMQNKFPHTSLFRPKPVLLKVIFDFSLWQLLLFVFCISVIFLIFAKNKKESLVVFIFSSLILVAYLIFLSLIRAGTPWGADPYSFSRYLCVLIFPLFAIQLRTWMETASEFQLWISLLLVVFASRQIALPISDIFPVKKRTSSSLNTEFSMKASKIKAVFGAQKNGAIWYINSDKNSLMYYVFRMKVMPYKVLPYPAGLNFYQNGNLRNTDVDPSKLYLFEQAICSVDFLYIDEIESQFWIKYRMAFDKIGGVIYRVDKENGANCSAVFVE
ncbi:hypothetical protein [Undibacterium sp. Ren11W]|uniref:hypothetical protein n=1 Tax=Undibacterium sp. Ren11W TaxID=3413045 RepID=UPI003BF392F9